MNIAELIKFSGPPDALIWKYPVEDFNTTSQLVVDETHEALLVMNGTAADLFPPGRHTLSTPNIPFLQKLINIPTDGKTPFTCKVFYINKVHQMDMLWGTQGTIDLEDPDYAIFLHVGLCGSLTLQVSDPRKFIVKGVGFREQFDATALIKNFRGIISAHVKNSISKIMINGRISYFAMNEHLLDISGVVKEKLDEVFDEYGVRIVFFNIESITVPEKDYEAVTRAKERRTSRIVEGYTWQEEKQMAVAEKFAGNEGTMGGVGGAVGGFMMGGAFGGTVSEIARGALSEDRIPTQNPPKDASGVPSPMGNGAPQAFNVSQFLKGDGTNGNAPAATGTSQGGPTAPPPSPGAAPAEGGGFCTNCGAPLPSGAAFCAKCGSKVGNNCTSCGEPLADDAAFCHKCSTKVDPPPLE